MKFKTADIQALVFGDANTSNLTFVELSEWVSDWKFEYADLIFSYDNKYYIYYASRSGSHGTDYYYSIEDEPKEIECPEVEKVEVVKYEWKQKNLEKSQV